MNTQELDFYLRLALPTTDKVVCALDELPDTVHHPTALIVNTDPTSQPGSHWVALYIPTNKQQRASDYFDTRGLKPHVLIHRFLSKTNKLGYRMSNRRLQSPFTTLCGAFCIDFLRHRQTNPNIGMIKLLSILYPFRNDVWSNDVTVHRRFESYFGVALPIIDPTLVR